MTHSEMQPRRTRGRSGSPDEATSAKLATLLATIDTATANDAAIISRHLSRRLGTLLQNHPLIGSHSVLIDYLQTTMALNEVEQFRVLFLDNKNRLIANEVMSEGTNNHCPVYVREVIRRALALGASAIILAHNHPSGDPEPSEGDRAMTRVIRDAGKLMGIALHDHIVVGKGQHISFAARGLI